MICNVQKWRTVCGVTCLTVILLMSCGKKEAPREVTKETASPAGGQEKPNTAEVVLPVNFNRHTEDLDGMAKRRNVRALVLLSPVGFFYDKGQPRGVNYEFLQEF